MKNKKIFKEMYSNKINKDKNFEEIVNNINLEKTRKSYKWILAPVCLVLIVTISILVDNNYLDNNIQNENKNNLNCDRNGECEYTKCDENWASSSTYSGKDNEININNISDLNAFKIDAKYEEIELEDLPKDLCINWTTKLFSNLKLSKVFKIMGKDVVNKSEYEDTPYDKFLNYELVYEGDNNKTVTISFSKDNKPIRDYHFSEEGSKKSIVKNQEYVIYNYEELYMTEFKYHGYYFDIETINVSEDELTLLLSIMF